MSRAPTDLRSTSATPATRRTRCRPLTDRDDAFVRDLFRSTVALGEGRTLAGRAGAAYERLCLDWYLGPGRDHAAVLELEERPVGYVLAGDDADHHRWARRPATAYVAGVAADHVVGPRDELRFHHRRLADGADRFLRPFPPPAPWHAHVNLVAGGRFADAGLAARDHVDRVVAAHGGDRWYGEINAADGRRAAALARLGLEVVHRRRSRTFSAVAGRRVDTLTVVRRVPS
ncbi:MAG: hypothetical protein S0880_31575 [Actinomycetota bacterium]|nr:hypothetical protein [Actinomycetota bacterium]